MINFSENINSDNEQKTKSFSEEENNNILKLTLLSQLVAMLSFPQVPFVFKMCWWLGVIEMERLYLKSENRGIFHVLEGPSSG